MERPRPRWLVFCYRLPRTPTRLRLGVWRRLKRVGAVLQAGGVWLLPADAKTQEHLEWLEEEIQESGGTAFLWEAQSLSAEQDRETADLFRRQAEERYAEIAATARALVRAIRRPRRRRSPERVRQALRQLAQLQRAIRLERRRDYFRVEGRARAQSVVQQTLEALERERTHPDRASKKDALDHPTSLSR